MHGAKIYQVLYRRKTKNTKIKGGEKCLKWFLSVPIESYRDRERNQLGNIETENIGNEP
jgi:hypothetical protein